MDKDLDLEALQGLAFNKGQEKEAFALAQRIRVSGSKAARVLALNVIAKGLFDQREFAESLKVWLELSKLTDDAGVWVSVVTSAVMAKDFTTADAYYPQADDRIDRYLKAKTGPEPPMPTRAHLEFYYVNAAVEVGSADRVLDKIEKLSKAYGDHVLTDSTHLFCAGAPFFDDFLDAILRAYPSTSTSLVWSRVFQNLAKVDEEGQAELKTLKSKLGL